MAGELYRGSYRSRGHERTVAGRQLAVYSRRGFAEEGRQRRRKEEKEEGGGGRENSRNLTTPHRRGGEKH